MHFLTNSSSSSVEERSSGSTPGSSSGSSTQHFCYPGKANKIRHNWYLGSRGRSKMNSIPTRFTIFISNCFWFFFFISSKNRPEVESTSTSATQTPKSPVERAFLRVAVLENTATRTSTRTSTKKKSQREYRYEKCHRRGVGESVPPSFGVVSYVIDVPVIHLAQS